MDNVVEGEVGEEVIVAHDILVGILTPGHGNNCPTMAGVFGANTPNIPGIYGPDPLAI